MPFDSGSGFDPHGSRRLLRGRQRGSRFRLLLILAVLLLAGGIAFERWLFSWDRGGSEPAPNEVQQTHAAEPAFSLPPPPSQPALHPVSLPVAGPAPRLGPEQQPARQPRLPIKIAFDVDVKAPEMGWFEDGRRPTLAKGCALRPGATIIRAVLQSTVQSEVAGQAIAQVSEDVYDVDGLGRLLIPAGTKVVGVFKAGGQLAFQRRRLDFVWTELTMPDGTQLALGDASGMDVAGAMGVGGEVRTRWGDLVATAALLTVFDAVQRTTIADERGLLASLQAAGSRQTGGLGEEVTRKVLDWEPEITIPGGTPIVIAPQKTVQVC